MHRRCAALLLVLSAAAVLAAFVRPGYRVEIRGHKLPGIYAPSVCKESESAARAAAEEICRGQEDLHYRFFPVLCLQYTAATTEDLTRDLLSSSGHICTLYAAYAGQTRLGCIRQPDLLDSIREEYLAQSADETAAAVFLSQDLRLEPVFTYPEAETDPIALSRALRRTTEVIVVPLPEEKEPEE